MNRTWRWLCDHTDLAHVIGGLLSALLFGFGGAIAVATTAELKDLQYGNRIDVRDIALTLAGGVAGGVGHLLILSIWR